MQKMVHLLIGLKSFLGKFARLLQGGAFQPSLEA